MRNGLVLTALAALTFAVVASPGNAAATTVAPSPKQVGAAFATTSSCGSLGSVGVTWTVTNNVVTNVVLTAIPTTCIGGSLSLTLVDSTNTSLASAGPITLAGATLTVTSLTGSATATSVSGAYMSVVGP